MGQISSHYYSNNLYDKIQNEIRHLLYNYNFWTNDQICDQLSLVYYDKLINFQKSELLGASASIGITHDSQIDKDGLCKMIIEHYKRRITLLTKIKTALDSAYLKILNSTAGPVCKNVDAYIDDFFECKKANGIWLNQQQYQTIIENIKKTKGYETWINHVHNLDNNWKKYLHKLNNVVMLLKNDVDNKMSNAMFTEVEKHTNNVIRKMNYVCDIFYLLVVNFS